MLHNKFTEELQILSERLYAAQSCVPMGKLELRLAPVMDKQSPTPVGDENGSQD